MSHFNRLSYNIKIIKLLLCFALKYPDLRFFQLLWATGIITQDIKKDKIVDKFEEESVETFKKLKTLYRLKFQEK